MQKQPPFARITITLPQEDLQAADRLAGQQDRSRSWIVAEAIRCYVASLKKPDATLDDLGSSRRAQLQRDMALTPQERVRQAEETQRLAEHVSDPLTFATFDEFLKWRRAGGWAT